MSWLRSDYYHSRTSRVGAGFGLVWVLFFFVVPFVLPHIGNAQGSLASYYYVSILVGFLAILPLLYAAFRWKQARNSATSLGGFMCPRCLYKLEASHAIDIDLARPGREGSTATRTTVHCPECGLATNVADLYKHWWIGPHDPRRLRKERGVLWPLNRWWFALTKRPK